MNGKRFDESQIIKVLKSHEAGTKLLDICRELGIVEQTFYYKFIHRRYPILQWHSPKP